jgi:rod shape determining protein RodA
MLSGFGLIVLYSASGESLVQTQRQAVRLGVAFVVMLAVAQINPATLRRWSPWLYTVGLVLLLAVLFVGQVGKGAQRWLDLGIITFQPSELVKLGVPLMIAWYLAEARLPPSWQRLGVAALLIIVPVLLIAKQPDLGTALLVASAGIFVLFLAGISWRLIGGLMVAGAAAAPVAWYLMRDYQRQRVLTFLDPENDPLGAGYHIIQSKIAIGSGGLYGKGWLNGTQSQLDFLPERHTDFIFAVLSEEFGLIGVLILLALYLFVIGRGLYIATRAQDTYTRLLGGALILVFFVYLFVNTGMVTGLMPVVGVPLPLVSYGGTSLVTLMAAFGILMSIHTHRRLLPT